MTKAHMTPIIYLRKESTIDELLHNELFSVKERQALAKKKDVVCYLNFRDVIDNKH